MQVVITLPPLEVARAPLIAIGVVFGCYLVWRAQEVLLQLVLAILVATAIEPLVKLLRRLDQLRLYAENLRPAIVAQARLLPGWSNAPRSNAWCCARCRCGSHAT